MGYDTPDLLFCKCFNHTYLCRLIAKFFNLFRMKKAYVSKHCNEKRVALEVVEIESSWNLRNELGFGCIRSVGWFGICKIAPAVEMNLYIRL